jgi:hypothetical protein
MRWAGHVARMGGGAKRVQGFGGKPESKDYLKDQSVDGIKMDLSEIGWEGGVEWIHLAQDRDRWRAFVQAVMNLQVRAVSYG